MESESRLNEIDILFEIKFDIIFHIISFHIKFTFKGNLLMRLKKQKQFFLD